MPFADPPDRSGHRRVAPGLPATTNTGTGTQPLDPARRNWVKADGEHAGCVICPWIFPSVRTLYAIAKMSPTKFVFGIRYLLGAGVRLCDLVDDPLDDNDADVDVAGYIGEKFGNEVVHWGGRQADGIAGGGGGKAGALTGDIEVCDFVVNGKSEYVRVIDHVAAIVTLSPGDLYDGMEEAVRNAGVGHAVIVGILVSNGGNKKSAEEFAGGVFGIADADVAEKAGKAGTVWGVGIRADVDGRIAGNGDEVERIAEIADGEPALFFGSERLDLGPVEEARVPIDYRNIGRAGSGLDRGKRGRGNAGGIESADGRGRSNGGASVTELAWTE